MWSLSLSLSFYRSISLLIFPFFSFPLSRSLSLCCRLYLSLYPSINPSIHQSICLWISLSLPNSLYKFLTPHFLYFSPHLTILLQQGVNPSRVKPLPLTANLDLLTYSAKQQMLKVTPNGYIFISINDMTPNSLFSRGLYSSIFYLNSILSLSYSIFIFISLFLSLFILFLSFTSFLFLSCLLMFPFLFHCCMYWWSLG